MCSPENVELSRSIYSRARRFYITRPWGMNINPITLASIFEKVDSSRTDGRTVKVDSQITLLDLQESQICEVQIVTPQNSRPEEGKISILSPLGAALMGARNEETVSIPVLGRLMKFKVIKVD